MAFSGVFNPLNLLLCAGLLLAPSPAFATRIARFVVTGQNFIRDVNVKSPVESSCMISIVNSGATPQVVTYQIKAYAVSTVGSFSGPGTDGLQFDSGEVTYTLAASGSNGSNCTNASDSCTPTEISFPSIPAGQMATQNVRCEGFIKVDDAVPGTPGFVTASGTLTTFIESNASVSLTTDILGNFSGGTGKNFTTAPTFTPIVIGEGRPF